MWTTDFTYISIGPKRHVYLCAILDLYSRKCIAWKVSDRIDAGLACDTLEIAIKKRKENLKNQAFFILIKAVNLSQLPLESY